MMRSFSVRSGLFLSVVAVFLLVCPIVARGDGDIRITITGISQDGKEVTGEGSTIYTVTEVPTVSIGDDRTLGTLRVTNKTGQEKMVQPGERIRVTLPPGTCYMRRPTAESYRNYVQWPTVIDGKRNRIADKFELSGINFVKSTSHSLTVEVANIDDSGQVMVIDFIFNQEGFSTVRVSPLIEVAADGQVDPQSRVTRMEFFKWLADVTLPFASCPLVLGELKESNYESFTDLTQVEADNLGKIRLLLEAGLITGSGEGKLRPDQYITRAEAVSLIGRIYPAGEGGEAAFHDSIPEWAKSGVKRAQERGIAVGYPDGNFRPDQPLVRSEALIILQKTLESYTPKE